MHVNLLEQILNDLSALDPNYEIAFLVHDGKVFFSRFKGDKKTPSSATIKLIQGLFDTHADLSFFLLRNRIYTTEELSDKVKGFVKLTAKRVTRLKTEDRGVTWELPTIEVGHFKDPLYPVKTFKAENTPTLPKIMETPSEAAKWVSVLAESVARGEVLHDHNRAVGVIITDSVGAVLSSATNQASFNKTLHAEIVAIQEYYRRHRRSLPPGSKIYVSLKPCRMCAAMIAECVEDLQSVEINFLEFDKGPHSRGTVLDSQLKHMPF